MNKEKRCMYCSVSLTDGRIVDVCNNCGVSVWGEKMFENILRETGKEFEKGNLDLGQVGSNNSLKEDQEIRVVDNTVEEFEPKFIN